MLSLKMAADWSVSTLHWILGRFPPCCLCGEAEEPKYAYDGGSYCIDCWPGYNLCRSLGCVHYRCEHTKEGCLNAGCSCAGFISEISRDPSLFDASLARLHAYNLLSETEGVLSVDSKIEVSVSVTSHIELYDLDVLEGIQKVQDKLASQYPEVKFKFSSTYGTIGHEETNDSRHNPFG